MTKERDQVLEFLRSFISGGVNQDFKPWARELYAKLYGSPDEPDGEHGVPTDGQLMDQLEAAFEKMNAGYVCMDMVLREQLARTLVRFNRGEKKSGPPEYPIPPTEDPRGWK